MADDDFDDIILVMKALKECKCDVDFRSVEDGEEAIEYLTWNGRYKDPELGASPEPYPARCRHAQEGWAPDTAGDQKQSGNPYDPRGGADDFQRQGPDAPYLQTWGQRFHHETNHLQ